MNKLMCFLTGGHKYRDANIKSTTHPYDSRWLIMSNKCIKCGKPIVMGINIESVIKHDFIDMGMDFRKGGKDNEKNPNII